jgi:dipeptidyl aminopeptidase/acylaminoacyl peptidase
MGIAAAIPEIASRLFSAFFFHRGMPRQVIAALTLGLLALGTLHSAEDATPANETRSVDSVTPFFTPFATERAALAPDGKHVAYTLHRDHTAYVIIMDVERPQVKLTVAIGEDRAAVNTFDRDRVNPASDEPDFGADEKTPATVPFLVWAGPNRLNVSNDVPELVAVDGDGAHPGKLVDQDDVSVMLNSPGSTDPTTPPNSRKPFVRRPPKVLALLPDDPEHILVSAEALVQNASSLPEYLVSVYRADVHTGKLKSLHEESFPTSAQVLYDRDGRVRLMWTQLKRRQTYAYTGLNGRGGDFAKFAGDEFASSLYRSPENYLSERSFPVAFDYDPNVAYVASNAGRATLGLYAVDLRTKQRTAIGPDKFSFDAVDLDHDAAAQQLVFDRYQKKLAGIRITGITPSTYWLDPDLAKIQHDLDRSFPARFAQILEWDRERSRFLVQVSSCPDPGRLFIFFRADQRALEFMRFAPELDIDAVSQTKPFEFTTPVGVHLSGYLTRPSEPLINPPPLLLFCHDPLLGRSLPQYDRDVRAFAAMGFVVAQVNYRGTAGFGRAHRDAFLSGLPGRNDRAPIDDLLATVEWIAGQQRIDRKRIALFGSGYGGTLALRALELEPERFRCAIAIDAPTDLRGWLNYGDVKQMGSEGALVSDAGSATGEVTTESNARTSRQIPVDFFAELRKHIFASGAPNLDRISPLQEIRAITKPVFLIQDRSAPDIPPGQSSAFCRALRRQGVTAEFLEVGPEFTRRLPKTSAQTFGRIREFVNLNLYDFDVKAGTPRVK